MSGTELVNWEERMAQEAKAVAELYRPSVGRISFKSGVMSYAGNPIPGNSVNVIILNSAFERNFYADRYSPDRIVNPACFSISLSNVDQTPHEAVTNPISKTCDPCKYNQWKSDLNGRDGKACKELIRLIMIPATDMTNEAIAKAEIAIAKIPVTSVKSWGNYVGKIRALYSRPPYGVVTRVSITPHIKNQFTVNFDEVAAVDVELVGAVIARASTVTSILLAPYDYTTEEKQEEPTADTGKKKKY